MSSQHFHSSILAALSFEMLVMWFKLQRLYFLLHRCSGLCLLVTAILSLICFIASVIIAYYLTRSSFDCYLHQLKRIYEAEYEVPIIQVLWHDTNRKVDYVEPVLQDMGVLVDEQHLGIMNSPQLKKSLTLHDVFDIEVGKGNRMIVQGRAGSGKTTLLRRLTKMWLQKEIWTSCKVLLKIPLRRSTYKNVSCLEEEQNLKRDLFSLCGIISKEHHNVDLDDVINEVKMEEVCILLDGLDEYRNARQHCENPHSFIYRIVTGGVDSSKEVLPHVTLVVTSRSAVLNEGILNGQHVQRKLEIEGFDENGVEQFVQSFFHDSPGQALKLIEELRQNAEIRYVCYNPLLLTFVVYIHALGGKLPKTETGIHIAFVTATLKKEVQRVDMGKHLQKPCRYLSLSSYESIDKCSTKLGTLFRETALLAYKGTFISANEGELRLIKTDFSWSEVPDGLHDASFGFLFSNEAFGSTYNPGGMSEVHSFLHLVIQEFLAAFHITQLNKTQQMEIIQDAVGYQAVDVIRYYCGLFSISFHDESLLSHFIRNSAHGDSIECSFQSQSDFAVSETLANQNYVLHCDGVMVFEWSERENIPKASCPSFLDYCSDPRVINLVVRKKWDFYVSRASQHVRSVALQIGPACVYLNCGIVNSQAVTSATAVEIDTSPEFAEYMPSCLKEHHSQAAMLCLTFKSLVEKAPDLATVTIKGTWKTNAAILEVLIDEYRAEFLKYLQEIIVVDYGEQGFSAGTGILLTKLLNSSGSLKRLQVITEIQCYLNRERLDENDEKCYNMSGLYVTYILVNWQLKETLTHMETGTVVLCKAH